MVLNEPRSPRPHNKSRLDRHRSRPAQLEHPVHQVARDHRFDLLRTWLSSTKPIAEDRLVTEEHVLDGALAELVSEGHILKGEPLTVMLPWQGSAAPGGHSGVVCCVLQHQRGLPI